MVSTFTPNVQLEEPARGDDVGTWDTPVNNNMSLIDLIVGGITTIGLNNSNVVLSAAQYKARHITFNSTLAASVTITFPTSFTKSYEIEHLCTGSSAYTITLQTTATGGQVICAAPGEAIEVWNDGTNLKYKNLDRVGSYWDHAGSSVPNWVSGCTVPPYLNCDGTSFSSATYPQLNIQLGGTTLPDSRGRFRLTLNQGTARVTTASGGVDGNTLLASGGSPTITLGTSNLPPYTPAGSVSITQNANTFNTAISLTAGGATVAPGANGATITGSFTGSAQGGVSQAFPNVSPTLVGGLTLIRAA